MPSEALAKKYFRVIQLFGETRVTRVQNAFRTFWSFSSLAFFLLLRSFASCNTEEKNWRFRRNGIARLAIRGVIRKGGDHVLFYLLFFLNRGRFLPGFNTISRDDTWSRCSAITSLAATHRTNIEAIRTDRTTLRRILPNSCTMNIRLS